MFYFLHCYMPETWQAQIDSGLINKNSGIRFSQSIDIPEDKQFNNLAKKNGTLYNMVREMKCPFYIDRLQGGCFFEGYDYDMALVEEYRKILGENFWGFQMHEWMSNVLSDIEKLTGNNCEEPWTAENIRETIFKAFPYEHLFLEAMNENEMAQMGHVRTAEEYLESMYSLFSRRQKYTGGMLLPCDSAIMAPKIEFELGAKRIMPEVGAQTVNSRIQIAYARGMAKGYKRSFGVYYEPWGGSPFSSCCYQRDGLNEWNINAESFPFKTAGGNGGSSRSLQKRIFIYAYFAGAQFLSEEWGMCNTFYDWNDFELTPYGEIKRGFIRFTEKYGDIGELMMPVAVVLPKDMPALDGFGDPDYKKYLSFDLSADKTEKLGTIRKTLWNIFVESGEMLGSETMNMRNYKTADAVDIVHEDCFDEKEYRYLIDLTFNGSFAKKHSNIIAADELQKILNDELPCDVDGDIHYMVSRRSDGTFFVLFLNNSGVERSVEKGEFLLKEADVTAALTVKSGAEFNMLEGNGTVKSENGRYYISVPAGGWLFGNFR